MADRTPADRLRVAAELYRVSKGETEDYVAMLACADAWEREQQRERETCGTCADWKFSGYAPHPFDERGSCVVGRCGSNVIFNGPAAPEYPSTHGCRAYRSKTKETGR